MADSNDLITSAYALSSLRAANVVLSSAQAEVLPTLITAASKAIVRWCERPFASQSYDEVLDMPLVQPGEIGSAKARLIGSPVTAVTSVRTARTAALTISNTDTTTNQRATVSMTQTGDADLYSTLTRTGLTLTRVASGVSSSSSLLFADYATISLLAAAISALGNGWTATATTELASYPSTELVGAEDAQDAKGTATLDIFRDDITDYQIDRAAGVINVNRTAGAARDWSWYWPGLRATPQVRVAYTAGYATIPEPIQQVASELLKAAFDRLINDSTVQNESADGYSYTMWAQVQALPAWAKDLMDFYRVWSL